MNSISDKQLFSILLCVKAFNLICLQSAADASQMAGAAISIAAQLLLAVPMLILYRQKNFSLKKEMLFGRAGKLLYVIFFIIGGAFSFNRLWHVSTSVYFPVDSSLACALILGAVCLYCASLKLCALSRASLIIAGILVFSLILLILGAYSQMDLTNYIPDADIKSVIDSGFKNFCSSAEPVMLFILLDHTSVRRQRGVTAFFIGTFLLTELIYLIEITVLGKIIYIADFPFFTAGAFSQPFSTQRADSIYMITFALLCTLTVSLQLILGSLLLKEVLPDLKYNTLLSVILMLGLSALINTGIIDLMPVMGVLVIILSVVIPIIMLIRRKINEKGTGSDNSGNDPSAVRVQS